MRAYCVEQFSCTRKCNTNVVSVEFRNAHNAFSVMYITRWAQPAQPRKLWRHTPLPFQHLQSSHSTEPRLAATLCDVISIVFFFHSFRDEAGRSDMVMQSFDRSYVEEHTHAVSAAGSQVLAFFSLKTYLEARNLSY